MDIKKSHWHASEDSIQLSVPMTKVDKERRLVYGFATLDNVDSQGDVVTAESSVRAFSRARKNLREMHAPVAVGKVVDFKEDTFYDKKTEKFYQGVYVTAYVSKGAQDTWEKVLDGTLSGFSIGGAIVDYENVLDKATGSPVRFIKDYELLELSLVDNPANQLANVFSIAKSADTTAVKGIAVDVETENIFYCETDEVAKTSSNTEVECSACGTDMTNIGWFERGSDVAKSVAEAVAKFTTPDTNEGGVEVMAEKITKSEEEVVEVPEEQTVVETAEEGSEAGEQATEVEEVAEPEAVEVSEVEDDDLTKIIGDLRIALEKKLESNEEEIKKNLSEIDSKFEKKFEEFDSTLAELKTKHAELTQKFAGLSDGLGEVKKGVETLSDSTAIKKSGDLGGSSEDTGKRKPEGIWKGTFFNVDSE